MIKTLHGLECDGQDGEGCEVGIDPATGTTPEALREKSAAEGWKRLEAHPVTGKPADVCPWCWDELTSNQEGENT